MWPLPRAFVFRLLPLALAACALSPAWLAPVAAHAAPKGPSAAEKAKASALSAQAKLAFQEKRYDESADLYMQVYDLVKNEASVYNAARAKELGGKLVEAKALYELFARIDKTPKGQADAAKRIAEIEEKLRQEAAARTQADADARAKADADAKGRAEAEAKLREAEAKTREAEAKAREAEARARQETAAKVEAEQRARASEAEAKAREAELRAQQAEARAKAAEDRARGTPPVPGSTGAAPATAPGRPPTPATAGTAPAAGASGRVLTPPPAAPVPVAGRQITAARPAPQPEPEPEPDGVGIIGGVVLAGDGGAHLQQSAPDGAGRIDVAWGLGATGHLGIGPRRTRAWVSLLAGMRYFQFVGYDSNTDPKQAPAGLAFSFGLAFPRLAGLQAYLQRYDAKMATGAGDFGFTTLCIKLAVAPKTGYLAFGYEGLVSSDRATTDIANTDEIGYGPTARFFVEFGFNLANGGLSK